MAADEPDTSPAPGTGTLGGLPVSDALGARTASVVGGSGACEACGSPQARSWSTPDGPARLCPPCATLNGIGCP
jgi:hypothetical protein